MKAFQCIFIFLFIPGQQFECQLAQSIIKECFSSSVFFFFYYINSSIKNTLEGFLPLIYLIDNQRKQKITSMCHFQCHNMQLSYNQLVKVAADQRKNPSLSWFILNSSEAALVVATQTLHFRSKRITLPVRNYQEVCYSNLIKFTKAYFDVYLDTKTYFQIQSYR